MNEHQQITLDLGAIHPPTGNPRTHFDQDAMEELGTSIARHGVLQPILVRPVNSEFV